MAYKEKPKVAEETTSVEVARGPAGTKLFNDAQNLIKDRFKDQANVLDPKEMGGGYRNDPTFHTYVKKDENGKPVAVLQGFDITVGGKKYFFESYGIGSQKDLQDLYKITAKPVVVEAAKDELMDKKGVGFNPLPVTYLQPPVQEGETKPVGGLTLMVRGVESMTGKDISKLCEGVYGAYELKGPQMREYMSNISKQLKPEENYHLKPPFGS